LHDSNGRYNRKESPSRAPLSRVWRAISDSSEFGTWFGVPFEGPFVAGASLRGKITGTKVDPEVAELQKPHQGKPFNVIVEQMEPERRQALAQVASVAKPDTILAWYRRLIAQKFRWFQTPQVYRKPKHPRVTNSAKRIGINVTTHST
jgi:hypothetical protein